MTTGKVSTYDLTVGVKLDVEDTIWLISPFDVPLLGTNGADGRSTLSHDTCFEKKVEWLDETLLTPTSTLAATATTGETVLTVASGDQLKFQTGDIILHGTEYVRVTDYGTTADTLIITRAYASSTATTLTSGDVVVGVGSALAEGSDPPAARSIDRNNRYNITQIFGPTKVHVTGTENVVAKYGLHSTEFDHQVANRVKEQMVQLELAIMYGTRNEDSGNKWRTMGGFTYYITTNVDSATTSLTEATLLTQLQACYTAGGSPDRILVGPKQKKTVSGFTGSTLFRTQGDGTRGAVVDTYLSDFGPQSVVLSRWVRTPDLFIFSREQAEVDTLRPATFEMLAKTGDAISGQVVMEKTMKFRRQQWSARFSALT
jgi:hypothetical protein